MQIDVRSELEEFEWIHAKWTQDKLIAASPFRFDRSPSFFVRLEDYGDIPAGVWSDSGAYDEEWRSGTITKLLAFLRNETEEETSEYLTQKYDFSVDNEVIRLKSPKLPKVTSRNFLNSDIIEVTESQYLTKRGISADIQRIAKTGRSRYRGFTAIPWYTPNNRLANVKYRATRGKVFFYEKGAWPIRELVYGANMVSEPVERLIVCEAEIDALSWWTAGIPAIALGGVAFSDKQADIIRRLLFDTLVLAGDNDKAGRGFNKRVYSKLRGISGVKLVEYGEIAHKDANAILKAQGGEALRRLASAAVSVPMLNVL